MASTRLEIAFGLDTEYDRVMRRGTPLAIAVAHASRGMDLLTRMRFARVLKKLLLGDSCVLRSEMAIRVLGSGLGEPGPWVMEPEAGIDVAEERQVSCGRSSLAERRACGLIRALRMKYDVPEWMWRGFLPLGGVAGETPWLPRLRAWTLAVGNGQALRKQPGLPAYLTRAAAHLLSNAPGGLHVPGVFRWAQFAAVGVDDAVARRVAQVPWWVFEPGRDAFWGSVAEWAAAQGPTLRPEWTLRVLHQFWRLDQTGQVGDLARWTPEVLLRRYADWAAARRSIDRWSPSGIAGRVCPVGAIPPGGFIEIVELLTAADLKDEAHRMQHCVAEYVGPCSIRRTAVFSVRRRMPGTLERVHLATLEVDLIARELVQCRAEFNDPVEMDVRMEVAAWARSRQLKMNRRGWA